jgi:hypothetical protein
MNKYKDKNKTNLGDHIEMLKQLMRRWCVRA